VYAAFAREGGARRRRAGASCGRERPAGVPTRGAGRGVRMRDVELVSGALDRRGAGPTSPAPTDAETHGELRRAGEVTGAWARAGGDKVGAGVRDAGGVPRMGVGEKAAIWTPSAQSGPPAQASGDVDRCSTSAGRSPRVRTRCQRGRHGGVDDGEGGEGGDGAGADFVLLAHARRVRDELPARLRPADSLGAEDALRTSRRSRRSAPNGRARQTLFFSRGSSAVRAHGGRTCDAGRPSAMAVAACAAPRWGDGRPGPTLKWPTLTDLDAVALATGCSERPAGARQDEPTADVGHERVVCAIGLVDALPRR